MTAAKVNGRKKRSSFRMRLQRRGLNGRPPRRATAGRKESFRRRHSCCPKCPLQTWSCACLHVTRPDGRVSRLLERASMGARREAGGTGVCQGERGRGAAAWPGGQKQTPSSSATYTTNSPSDARPLRFGEGCPLGQSVSKQVSMYATQISQSVSEAPYRGGKGAHKTRPFKCNRIHSSEDDTLRKAHIKQANG